MTDNDVEIGRLVGQALRQENQTTRQAIVDGFTRLEQNMIRLASPPTHNAGNGQGTPMVVHAGGMQPTFNFDYRAFGEALITALTPTFNQQAAYIEKVETLIDQVTQLVQAVASMEIRPTINVPQAAVSVELPPTRGSFKVEHSDGTTSRVTMEG